MNLNGNRNFRTTQMQCLIYQPSLVQGECTLKSVKPIRLHKTKYAFYLITSCILMGVPILLASWFPQLPLFLYYNESSLGECTHFAIQQLDGTINILQKCAQPVQNQNIAEDTFQDFRLRKQRLFFVNRYLKYIIESQSDFHIIKADQFDFTQRIERTIIKIQKNQKIEGYDQQEVQVLLKRFGPGVLHIQNKGMFYHILSQINQPLYLFIVIILLLWLFYFKYTFYSIVILISAILGILLAAYQTYTSNKNIHLMAYNYTVLPVLRKNEIVEVSSDQIVPGDIVFLKDPIKIPFDAIILRGAVLLNQCALTGQSCLVLKKGIHREELRKLLNRKQNMPLTDKNTILSGTQLIQVQIERNINVQKQKSLGAPVFVIRTNFTTIKGQLIRTICFPSEKKSKFEKQSYKFLVFMFIFTLLTYIILLIRLQVITKWDELLGKFLYIISISMPPGLPVSMTFGTSEAMIKLKKKGIYCLSSKQIVRGGQVDLICFDKTGTLTEIQMQIGSIAGCNKGQFFIINHRLQLNELENSVVKWRQNQNFVKFILNMGCNHSIAKIKSTGQMVGDPINMHMEDNWIDFCLMRSKLSILKKNQFNHEIQRMSVVVKIQANQVETEYILFVKGSPQSIKKISLNSSLPPDFDEQVQKYTSSGFRLLCFAHKRITLKEINWDRGQSETRVNFDGFVSFQNKLKKQTKGTIQKLLQAQLPCIIITGDNAWTACHVASECNILNSNKRISIFDYDQSTQKLLHFYRNSQKQIPYLNKVENHLESRFQFDLQQNIFQFNKGTEEIDKITSEIIKDIQKGSQICLTGKIVSILYNQSNLSTMTIQKKNILHHTKVFARTKPNQKTLIVMSFQAGLNKIVAMCGDGVNDSGALKQADAGMSFTQSEASISSPFTSKVYNISAIVQLIKQCRAGLITNYSLFNIMANYTLVIYFLSFLCEYYFCDQNQMRFLYQDLACNFFFILLYGNIEAQDYLSSIPPPASLFTLSNLAQLIILLIIGVSGQIFMIFTTSTFFPIQTQYFENGGYENNKKAYITNKQFATDTPETSILFIFTCFIMLFSFWALDISGPWRKGISNNKPLSLCLLGSLLYLVLMTIVPRTRPNWLKLNYLDVPYVNLFVLLSSFIFGLLICIAPKCISCCFKNLEENSIETIQGK